MKAALPLILAVTTLAGCAYPASAQTEVTAVAAGRSSATVTVSIGGRASVNGVSIQPLRLIEDSRCPMDVMCIQRGRLAVEAVIGTGRDRRTLIIKDTKPLTIGGGTLTLVGSVLARHAGSPPPTSFIFRFERS